VDKESVHLRKIMVEEKIKGPKGFSYGRHVWELLLHLLEIRARAEVDLAVNEVTSMMRMDTTWNKIRKTHTISHLLHHMYLRILLETTERKITGVASDSRTRQMYEVELDYRSVFKSCLFSSCASILDPK